jgi:xanthosine utilization system XapX-like protein
MDVFVTETGTGTGVAQLYPNIVFSIVAVTPPAPPATPAPPSLLLAIAGIGMAIAYLSWRRVARLS